MEEIYCAVEMMKELANSSVNTQIDGDVPELVEETASDENVNDENVNDEHANDENVNDENVNDNDDAPDLLNYGNLFAKLQSFLSDPRFTKETYSLKLITDFMKTKGYTYTHTGKREICTETGIRVELAGEYSLSVQTHPMICQEYFCETALIRNDHIDYDSNLGYDDVLRHQTPTDFFEHFETLVRDLGSKPA